MANPSTLDDGLRSRKFLLTLIGFFLITGTLFLLDLFPALIPVYQTYCGTIISVLAIYFGVNWGQKYIASKQKTDESGEE